MNPNETMAEVGLVGLGLLGSAIAGRLMAAGFRVRGYDLSAERRAEFLAAGGHAEESAAAVIRGCPRVLLSLPTSSIVAEVISSCGKDLRPGQLVIDTTTGAPDETEAIGALLESRRVGYVDATVAGSSRQTREGDGIVLAGGAAADVERAAVLLRTFARGVHHVGPCGAGARMKLVVNLVLGLNRAVLAEGLEFAAAIGLNRRQALAILKDSPAASRVMETKGEKMVSRDFAPEARLAQHLKDVRLILEAGARRQARLPLSELHANLLQSLVDHGIADLDNSAIVRAFEWNA